MIRDARNALLGWLRIGVSVAGGLVTIPVVINRLSTPTYGAWTYLQDLANYSELLHIGVGVFLVRKIAIASSDDKSVSEALGLCGVLGIVAASLVFVIVAEAASTLNGSHPLVSFGNTTWLAAIIALGVLRTFIAAPLVSVLQGASRWAHLTAVQTVHTVCRVTVVLAFLERGDTLQSLAILVVLVDWLFAGVLLHVTLTQCAGLLHRPVLPSLRFVHQTLLFSVGATFLLSLFKLMNYTDTIMIARFLGPESVALFSIPQQMGTYFGLMCSVIAQIMYPQFARWRHGSQTRTDGAQIRYLIERSALHSGLVLGACAGASIAVAPSVVELWIGRADYVVAVQSFITPVMMTALLRGVAFQVPVSLLIAGNRTHRAVGVAILGGITKLVVSLLVLPLGGLWALCVTNLITSVVFDSVLMGLVVRGEEGVPWLRQIARIQLPSIAALGAGYGASEVALSVW